MARPAEVFVRPLTMSEGQKLQRITRRSKDPVRSAVRRAVTFLTIPAAKASSLLACRASRSVFVLIAP